MYICTTVEFLKGENYPGTNRTENDCSSTHTSECLEEQSFSYPVILMTMRKCRYKNADILNNVDTIFCNYCVLSLTTIDLLFSLMYKSSQQMNLSIGKCILSIEVSMIHSFWPLLGPWFVSLVDK